MIKYVLFDLDGTLTESAPGIINSVRYALRRYGIENADEKTLTEFVGPPLIESFKKFYGFSEEKAVEAVDVYREYFSEKGLFENSVYGGVEDCLKRLKSAGLRLGVATSKPQVFCERILKHFGLSGYFDAVVGIPLDDEHMTKAEVIKRALGLLGVGDKAEAVMIGDRGYDAAGAKENGIDCIGVLYGYGSEEELRKAGVSAVCRSAEELAELILKNI